MFLVFSIFRSARTFYRTFVRPSIRPPAPIFPELIDELKHCRQASGTPQIVYFLKAHDVIYPNSDKNSNTETFTKTNTETNKKIETNKGRSWDTYGVIYFWKGDGRRNLNMICVKQGLRKHKYKHKHKDKYKNNQQNYDVICFSCRKTKSLRSLNQHQVSTRGPV